MSEESITGRLVDENGRTAFAANIASNVRRGTSTVDADLTAAERRLTALEDEADTIIAKIDAESARSAEADAAIIKGINDLHAKVEDMATGEASGEPVTDADIDSLFNNKETLK